MDLNKLMKEVHSAVQEYAGPIKDGIRIGVTDTRFRHSSETGQDVFEQDVRICFTRIVSQDSHEFVCLIDAVSDKELSRETSFESDNMFLNYSNYTAFRNAFVEFICNEGGDRDRHEGWVSIYLSDFREMLTDKIPHVEQMLPSDLFGFVRKMLEEHGINPCWSDFCGGFDRSYFTWESNDLEEIVCDFRKSDKKFNK